MSAKGQKRTSSHSMTSSAIASTSGGNSKTEGVCRLEVDNELECGRLLNRHFRRLFILEKSISLSFRTRSRTPLARAPSSTCAIKGFALFGLSNRWSLRDPTCDCVAMNLVLSLPNLAFSPLNEVQQVSTGDGFYLFSFQRDPFSF